MLKSISLILLFTLLFSASLFSQYSTSHSFLGSNFLNDNSHNVLIDMGVKGSAASEYYFISDIVISKKVAFNIKISTIYNSGSDFTRFTATGRYLTSSKMAFGGSLSDNAGGNDIVVYSVLPLSFLNYNIIAKIGISYYYNRRDANNLENLGYLLSFSKCFMQYKNLNGYIELFLSRSKLHYNSFAELAAFCSSIE